ncbi:MAG: hypothetical protein LIO40_05520 [Ruminococcus sp.]|nr:hypothetical protein [Ruminococcus sp.]
MSELNYASDGVPIKVNRIFDSCSDRDCLSDIPIVLDCGELPGSVNLVKAKCVRVTDICINIEPIPFNKGFFTIDLTYTFRVDLLAYDKACDPPALLTGTAYASKSCVLYGSESAVKTFFSDGSSSGSTNCCCDTINLPTVSVSVVEPVALETKIGMVCRNADAQSPENSGCRRIRSVIVTLGIFSVVELTRPVTIMVPTYEYTIPKKECCTDTDSPCEVFEKIKFPEEEFSPATLINPDCSSCGCCDGENG